VPTHLIRPAVSLANIALTSHRTAAPAHWALKQCLSVHPLTGPRIPPTNINVVSRQAVSADQYPGNMTS